VKAPLEVEIKLPVSSASRARFLLKTCGFGIRKPRVLESNSVLDDAKTTLRKRGLLLRVRRAGKVFTCTWKGAEVPGTHKRREEREFTVSDFGECIAVFNGLGYKESFRYEKYRTEFARPREPGHVTLDETPVGVYLELEGPARWIDATAKRLGYARADFITMSYGALYADWCMARGIKPSAMTFR
jgi:adenylate cyclase class 2